MPVKNIWAGLGPCFIVLTLTTYSGLAHAETADADAAAAREEEAGSLLGEVLQSVTDIGVVNGLGKVAACMARCATEGQPPGVTAESDRDYDPRVAARCVASCVGFMARDPEKEQWQGQISLGLVTTSGSADTRTFNGRIGADHQIGPRKDEFSLDGLLSTFGNTVTARRYVGIARTHYYFTDYNYWFGNFRYETDRSTGYEYQSTLVGGIGRRLVETGAVQLDVETGIGWRNSEQFGERYLDETVFRVGGRAEWAITPFTQFTQDLLVETGDVASNNTRTESITALSMSAFGGLAMRWSVNINNNSKVPDGVKHTEVINSVTLVYDI